MKSKVIIMFCLGLLCSVYEAQSNLIQLDRSIDVISVQQHIAIENKPYVQVVAFLDLRCGTCFVFLNVWNAVAVHFVDIRQYVHIQIADCARERLGCLSFNTTSVPSIRYFPPKTGPGNLGTPLDPGANLYTNVHLILERLTYDVTNGYIYIPPGVFQTFQHKPIREPHCCQIPDYEKNITYPPIQTTTYRPLPPPSVDCVQIPQKGFSANTLVKSMTRLNVYSLFPQNRPTFIGFYDTLCRPCIRFIDVWDLLASNFGNFSTILAVNCAVDPVFCDQYSTEYYPNVRYVPPRSPANSVGVPVLTDMSYGALRDAIGRILQNPM